MDLMMSHLNTKARHLLLVTFLFSVSAVNALTLNPLIEAPKGQRIISQQPLLFNQQIIFVAEKDDKHSLWAYNLTSNSYVNLYQFDEEKIIGKFYKVGNRFFFKERYEPSQIWQSDGTVSGTKAVSGLFVGRTNLHQQNNILFNIGTGTTSNLMIFFDGSTIKYYHSPSYPLDQSVCAFNVNDVVIPSLQSLSSNSIKLIRFNNNSQTNYTDSLTQAVVTNRGYTWFYDNTCFVYLYGQDLNDILVIPEQGDSYFLAEKLGFDSARYLAQFKGYYYAVTRNEQGISELVQLSSDFSEVISQVPFGHYGDIVTLRVSQDYLIGHVQSGGGVSPPYWYTKFFDENLNEVSDLGGSFTYPPKVYPQQAGEVVVYTDYSGQVDLEKLTRDITNPSSGLVFNANALNGVITSKDSLDGYVQIQDLQSNQTTIKKISTHPDMGSLSVGNWFDPDYQNQGMSIVEGVRDDGSRYLFITMYLFRDGQPLWLAGVGELNYPQAQLTIEMAEYNGIGLLEAGVTPNVEKFGDLNLSMGSCHQMMMTLNTTDSQSFQIDMQRMVNNDINHRCKD